MAWSPKLAKVPLDPALPVHAAKRSWVTIAEDHAEEAVRLLINIMNGDYSPKMRMEAAVRVLQIAGTSFKGERRDAQGRPAANLPGPPQSAVRLSTAALSHALRQLPPGAVKLSPLDVEEGERVVVFKDSEGQSKAAKYNPQSTIGALVVGTDIEIEKSEERNDEE